MRKLENTLMFAVISCTTV